jgi:glycerone phosphate O-acyltransferase
MAFNEHLDGFNDMLSEIAKQGDLMWITQQKNFQQNMYKQNRTPEQIKQSVLKSERLKHVISKVIENDKEKTITQEKLYEEATKILDEMGHSYNLKVVRFLGYLLMKVFKRIYKHIYYNSDLTAKINEISKRYPIIYLPNHRSYMDFLLVSLVCFHANIQLPSVAAGEDFLGLSHVSKLLRSSGAFFIRRSFGSDELYWGIFHEYVQQHLINADSPLEFFLEGTRSRTSKYLSPKQGMLATCLECIFKNQVSDIYIVPVSITYERLLEETLYSNELLGIPKPKENVSGLLKAHTILKQCYGSIIANFSQPLSVRELIARQNLSLNRQIHNLTPFFIFNLDKMEHKSIEYLSYTILGEISTKQIIQPISLIAASMLLSKNYEISLKDLHENMVFLKIILTNLGHKFYWPINFTKKFQIKLFLLNFLKIHSVNLFDFIRFNTVKSLYEGYNIDDHDNDDDIDLIFVRLKIKSATNLFSKSAVYLALCLYRNQIINYFVNIGLTAISLVAFGDQVVRKDNVLRNYSFLASVFNREFLFHPNEIALSMEKSLVYFKIMNIIQYSDDGQEVRLLKHNYRQIKVFISLIKTFLCNYLIVYKIILSKKMDFFENEKIFCKKLQEFSFEHITKAEESGNMMILIDNVDFEYSYELLSLNLLNNSVLVLKNFAILNRNMKAPSKFEYRLNLEKLDTLFSQLYEIILNLDLNLKKFDGLFFMDENFNDELKYVELSSAIKKLESSQTNNIPAKL